MKLIPVGVAVVSLTALLLWAASAALSTWPRTGAAGPVTTVAAVRAGLRHAPRSWMNRPIYVRAIVDVACAFALYPGTYTCGTLQPAMFDAEGTEGAAPLPVVLLPQQRNLLLLRRLPLAGQLVPPPQALLWGRAAVYRVEVRAAAHPGCHPATCYEALLLDAAPAAM